MRAAAAKGRKQNTNRKGERRRIALYSHGVTLSCDPPADAKARV